MPWNDKMGPKIERKPGFQALYDYQRTAEQWLRDLDRGRTQIRPVLLTAYGKKAAA